MAIGQRKFGPIPVWLFDSEVSQKSASKEMLEANKANEFVHGFDNAETLIMSIYNFYNENGKNIFAKGFNIDELSMYIERAKKKTPYDYKIIESTLIDEGRITQRQLNNCISNLEIGESIEDICKDYPSCSSDLRLYLETYQNTNELRKSEEIPIKFTQKTRMGMLIRISDKINQLVKNKNRNNRNKGGIVNGIE